MAGASTPAMAAAVSNSGGLGSLACALLTPGDLREAARSVALATNRPVNFNFFVHPAPDVADFDPTPMIEALRPLYAQFDLGEVPSLPAPAPGFSDETLEVLLECAPKIVSFHFGLPRPKAIDALKALGAVLIGNATSIDEARALEAAGVDAIIAQGVEAGGHRGAFLGDTTANDMGTLALTPLIADAVAAPVIAAGGIFDGRGVAAAFMLGACGAQIGSAFLRSPESAASAAHKRALAAAPDNSTRLTRAFTGRPARSLKNALTEALAPFEAKAAPFPLQRHWTGPLATAAAARGAGTAFQSLWSGQAGFGAIEAPTADIFRAICNEALDLLNARGT
jgi:nitronate monooxygenase